MPTKPGTLDNGKVSLGRLFLVRTTPPPGGRRVSWDVVRVGCVLMVLAFHATCMGPRVHPELGDRAIEFTRPVGASSLLLISGFFMAHSLHRGNAFVFWRGRLARLVPPFLVAVVATWLVLVTCAPPDWNAPSAWEMIQNLAMIWPIDPAVPYVDASYWTLPIQVVVFTVAAVLVARVRLTGAKVRWILWSAVLVPLVLAPVRAGDPPEWFRMIADTVGFHRLHMFALGVAVWLWATGRMHALELVGFGLLCVYAHDVHSQDPRAALGVGLVALVAASAAAGPDWGRLLPERVQRTFGWLAGISYGFYLTHQAIGYVVMRFVHDVGGGPLLQVGAMTANGVFLGWLLTRLVEQPAARVIVRRRKPTRSSVEAVRPRT